MVKCLAVGVVKPAGLVESNHGVFQPTHLTQHLASL
jgi:hypothetical protein